MLKENGVENCNENIKHNVRIQYLAIITANIISLCHGSAIGWLSPSLPKLQSPESPLLTGPINLTETSWLGSYFSIGAVLGNCIFGVLSTFIGRKNTLCILAFPNLLFWLCVLYAQYVDHLYIGRILAGVTGGGMYICIPLFVAEIADQRIRGRLGSLLMLSICTGVLCGFVAGTYADYYTFPKIFMPLPIIFFLAFIMLPESPQYYIANKRYEDAKKSLKFYKNCKCPEGMNCIQINKELTEMMQLSELNSAKKNEGASCSDLFEWKSIKAILIGFSLTGINLFSGTFAMINYTANIFQDSGSDWDPHTCGIVIAVIQICGVYASGYCVDRIGRKTLLTYSATGAFIGLTSLGAFSYLSKNGFHLEELNWIPLVSFSTYILATCFGILPLPFIILAEILPQKIRRVGSMICMIANSVFAFISLKTFPILMNTLELYGTAWICAGVCVYGILFSIFLLKETKGKNLNTAE